MPEPNAQHREPAVTTHLCQDGLRKPTSKSECPTCQPAGEPLELSNRLAKAIEILKYYFHVGQDGMDAIRFLETELLPWHRAAPAREQLAAENAVLRAELQTHRQDVEDAAGELMVDIEPPGTTVSKLLRANSIMRRQRDEANSNLAAAEAANEGLRKLIRDLLLSADASWLSKGGMCSGGHDWREAVEKAEAELATCPLFEKTKP